jgi:protein SCO1
MANRLLGSQYNVGVRYAVMSVLVVTLLAGGFLIGSVLNTALLAPPQTVSTDDSRPGAGAVVSPPHQVQDFTLTSHTGEPLNLHDLRGRAVLIFFGYTHCPDVCPTTLADYRRVKQALGDDADEVAFVFISVDGERDTPDVLTRYLHNFDTAFIGMTGDETALRRMGAEYGLMYQQEALNVGHEHEHGHDHNLDDESYFVQHTSPSFLIDRDGYLRLVYFYGTQPDVIAEGIRQVLN